MKRTLCVAAALMVAGVASAEIRIIQAEDAVLLGTNYMVAADTNVPPYAFETNYITSYVNDTAPTAMSYAFYDVGNLTSNALYDLYMRVHVGPGGYSDDSIFVNSAGFGTNSLTFSYQNGIAGRTGLDGANCSAAGFHWIKINGTGDLGWLGAFNAGAGTNLTFAVAARENGLDVDALAFVPANVSVTAEMLDPTNLTVEVWAVGGIPEFPTADSTPLIEAYFLDGAGTVDANSITMAVDGGSVTNFGVSYTNFVTTVSYTPVTDLTLNETHTARVVVATSPGGLFVTNEFTFYVGAPISYVDVTTNNTVMATTNDGPVGAGTAFITVSTNGGTLWRARTDFGLPTTLTNEPSSSDYAPYSANNSVYESDNNANCPRLKTTVYVSETNNYNVYTYFWSNGGGWDIGAGLVDTTNALPAYSDTSTNAVPLFEVGPDFWGIHTLYRVYLGTVSITDTNTPIVVYLEDVPTSGGRSWAEGVGYQIDLSGGPVGPTLNPDIQSYSIAGGTATFTWISEVVGTYKIMHKTNVTDAVWTPVKTDIGGGNPTTTDSVSLSGAPQEFFRIEGN